MAAVIGVKTLNELILRAERHGARFAWIDGEGRLCFARHYGATSFMADFSQESLHPEPAATSGVGTGKFTDGRRASDASVKTDARPPAQPVENLDIPSYADRQTGHYRMILEGRPLPARSQKELLLVGLTAIERRRPQTLQKLAAERSRTKRVVARDRDELNANVQLARRFSRQIEGGWWVFTNNSFPECEKFLRRAAFHAGLHIDVEKLA